MVRVRAAIVVIAVVLASSVFATAIGIYFGTREIANTASQNMVLVGRIASDMITSAIAKIEEDITYVSGMMDRAYATGGEENLSATLAAEVGPGPNFISLAVVFPDGRIISREKPDFDFAAPEPALYKTYLDLALDGSARVTDAVMTSSGENVIRCFMKISDGAVFISTLRGDYFSQLISGSDYGIYNSGRVFMVDGGGVVIADSNQHMLGERYLDRPGNVSDIVNAALQGTGTESVVDRYDDDYENTGEMICAYTPIVHDQELERWVLFISVPVSETPMDKMRNIFVISGLVFLALGALSSIFLSAMQARPYEDLDRQNELLTELKIEAEAAGRAKGDFLSNMSHEIRTPLNAVIGMTAIAKKAKGERRKDDCLTKIEESSQHLMGVINDILDMSKIEANKLELDTVDFSFEDMLRKVSGVIAFRIEEKGQHYSVEFDENIPRYISADEQRLSQVIANLLSNAVKFTPDGGYVKLSAKLEERRDGEVTLEFSVKDSGIGISKEQQSRLFQSFQQAEAGTSRKFGGTGLGLAISKSIVEMMDGRIWVDSEPDHGSVFSFTVKAREAQIPESALWTEVTGLRALAVISDAETAAGLYRAAERLSMSVDVAADLDGAAAVTGEFDVCIAEKLADVRGLCAISKAPAVLVATRAEWSETEDAAREAGALSHVARSFFTSDLLSAVAECKELSVREVASATASAGEFAGRRLLLAEDIDINREIVISLLETTGITVDEAENGRVAVDMFAAAPEAYDIILMDVQMPELDGYAATREIRALESAHAKTVPIIAMTANVFREDIEKCLEAGMNAHLGKPLSLEELLERLRAVL
ncbi:MAG: response regulator [Oscillospiraceae bacterium]|jgi:signal transduction histidine kinase/CheY-like chemotaxis protein|nr:response regulator [Oscillospiraceae bacterium]